MALSGFFERLAFMPIRGPAASTPGDAGWSSWRSVRFPSRDGKRLHGWLIEGTRAQAGAADTIVVHAHGNAGNIGHQFIPAISLCLEGGCDILMFDYRSFGESEPGKLNRMTVVEDLAGAIAFARDRYPAARLLLLGQSIGGATAALAMREESLRAGVDGLCLISAFADWNAVVRDVLASNPLTWPFAYPFAYVLISPARHEPWEGLADWPSGKPLLLVHGTLDDIVPPRHLDMFLGVVPAETLRAARILKVPGADHNSLGETPQQGLMELSSALAWWIEAARAAPHPPPRR